MPTTLTFSDEQMEALIGLLDHIYNPDESDERDHFCGRFPVFSWWIKDTEYTAQEFVNHVDNYLKDFLCEDECKCEDTCLAYVKDHPYYQALVIWALLNTTK
jgi:hypothetical protein